MAIVIDQFPARESQFTHPPAGYPTAFDRCECGHVTAQHGPTKAWNLLGPCLRCNCKRLEVES